MRVISQNRMIDVNYENTSLKIETTSGNPDERAGIYATIDMCGSIVLIAEYSTLEKAKQAMDMLHNLYEDRDCWNSYFYDYPKLFQFPEDGEI